MLEAVAQLRRQDPDSKLRVKGHKDHHGNLAGHQTLSKKWFEVARGIGRPPAGSHLLA